MKAKWLGLKNNGNYHYIVFRKTQSLLKVLEKILLVIDSDPYVISDFIYENGSEKENVKECDLVERKVNKMVDVHFNYGNEINSIDIVFGSKKVFVIGRFDKEVREEIMKVVRKECEFDESVVI